MSNKFKSKPETKTVKFQGEDFTMVKLSMRAMKNIQKAVSAMDPEDENFQMASVYVTVREGIVEAAETTDEEFDEFNPNDLANLGAEIMEYAGIDLEAAAEAQEVGNSAQKSD